ncbi:hypothetical protein A6770_29945 [Nostoc minutum NIES-26]|uniref:Uncharacterized protein n=1 Tax=Nostoc minutum NIES-26 TaxID=1844469 RepID=A0A367QDP6_9NOSO|nr:hypothetical protein A6770_29945 [Nostoc minutum NIES-26]
MDENGHYQRSSPLEQPESGILSNWLERIAIEQRIQTPSIVVRRSVYEKLGRFDCRFSCCGEDWEMWVHIAAQYPVWYEVEPLALYRIHSNSLSRISTRIEADTQELRMATEIMQTYLPTLVARKLSNKAKENVALYCVQDLVLQMLTLGDFTAATTQIQAALKCSYSRKVLIELSRTIFQSGKFWIKQVIKSQMSLKTHQ